MMEKDPSSLHLQRKPRTCVPQSQKFFYTDQDKSLTFILGGVAPNIEFVPNKSETWDLRADSTP
jgi:hypothetical protein